MAGRLSTCGFIATSVDGAPYFVTHHQPFNYFARFAPGTAFRRALDTALAEMEAGQRAPSPEWRVS